MDPISSPRPALIVLDLELPAARRSRCRPGHQVKSGAATHPGRGAHRRRRPRGRRRRLRRRGQHVPRQARHVPRPRQADEGLHRLLAGHRRAAAGTGRRREPAARAAGAARRPGRRGRARARARGAEGDRGDPTTRSTGSRRRAPRWPRSRSTRTTRSCRPRPARRRATPGSTSRATSSPTPRYAPGDPARRPRPTARPTWRPPRPACRDYLVHPSPATLERSLRYAITHQRALQRLAESEERHALALQGANDGLWDWDVRADRLYFSPRWKAMIGYPEAEIGDAPGRVARPRAPRRPRGAHAGARGPPVSGATQHFESEHRIQHRDGSYRWMLARGIAVRDHNGPRDARRRLPDRRHGPPRGRAAPAARRAARRADRAAQPRAVPGPPRPGDPPRAAPPARSPAPPCCSWTSTASSSSTTRSATTSATGC